MIVVDNLDEVCQTINGLGELAISRPTHLFSREPVVLNVFSATAISSLVERQILVTVHCQK